MATLPFFQQRAVARRRTSDIERLAKQYKQQVDQMTLQYQQAYGKYETETQTKMSEYEKQAASYNEAFADYTKNVLEPYQKQFADYTTALEQYNKDVEAYQKNPKPYDLSSYWVDQLSYVDINGKRVSTGDLQRNPAAYGFESAVSPFESGRRGSGLWRVTPKATAPDPGEFKGTVPKAPEAFAEKAPEAPQIGEFDTAQFDEQRAQLESTFKREVGERKAGRLAAVSRRVARPLLQGG